jgi:hypothetical protein
MHRAVTMKIVISALLLAGALGGCVEYIVIPDPPPNMPVLVAPSQGRKPLKPPPVSYKFRVAVLDFIDQTNAAGDLVRTIPDILTTNLFDSQRYDILDRGQLREKTPKEVEENIRMLTNGGQIDGKIVGSITRFSPQNRELTVDIRVINAQSDAVMFAVQQTLHYTGVLDVKVERDDIKAVATKVAAGVPRIQDARVAVRNGSEIVVNIGEDSNVKKGMAAFIIGTGDSLEDPASGDVLTSRYIIGEAYVTAVEQKISHAVIFRPHEGGEIRPGDLIHFK